MSSHRAASGGICPVLLLPLLLLLHLIPYASPMSFSFTNFQSGNPNITFQGDASTSNNGVIRLTNGSSWSAGWAVFSRPVRLWDKSTQVVTNFTTTFRFGIDTGGASSYGDGIAFFLAATGSTIPKNSAGGYLGLFEKTTIPLSASASASASASSSSASATASSSSASSSSRQLVAVEFDTKSDTWDPPYIHLGVDVGSIRSSNRQPIRWAFPDLTGGIMTASVTYDASSKNLSFGVKDATGGRSQVAAIWPQELANTLPEWVLVGFSAATSNVLESHDIYSWDFDSTLKAGEEEEISPTPSRGSGNGAISPAADGPNGAGGYPQPEKKTKHNILLAIVLPAVGGVAALALLVIVTTAWCRTGKEGKGAGGSGGEIIELGRDVGPVKYQYSELDLATQHFSNECKLGEGGFGSVYRGVLRGLQVAIKKIVDNGGVDGKKSFVDEVMVISGLSHKHLVRLLGWCEAKDHETFFIVYEYMPKRSLDFHLFGRTPHGQKDPYPPLPWKKRYPIAVGLASAVKYLHEDNSKLVIHRDIKPANVMLDEDFNARLGDFGLARFREHGKSLPPTWNAGTDGYMAPELSVSRKSKAGSEADVYSFGVVALQIASGQTSYIVEEPLAGWVVKKCRQEGGDLLAAADPTLKKEYVEREMRCLLAVGLWCTHSDPGRRKKMHEVVQYLEFQTEVPDFPMDVDEQPFPTAVAPSAVDRNASC